MPATNFDNLTPKEAEAYKAIRGFGRTGCTFPQLRDVLGIKGESTLRARIGALVSSGLVKSGKSGRTATYTANKPS